MRITLRKAHALQREVNGLLRKTIPTVITVDKYTDLSDAIPKGEAEASTILGVRTAAASILHTIRLKTSQANYESGISEKLAELAYLSNMLESLQAIGLAKASAPTDDVLTRRQADLTADLNRQTYGEKSFTVSVLSKTTIDTTAAMMRSITKAKQKLADELLELNIRTEIELPDDQEAFLTQIGFI